MTIGGSVILTVAGSDSDGVRIGVYPAFLNCDNMGSLKILYAWGRNLPGTSTRIPLSDDGLMLIGGMLHKLLKVLWSSF